jgi:hypothetical protein
MRIARGIVVGQTSEGLVLHCSGWIVRSLGGYLYPGDGQGMNVLYANLVDVHEQFQFGRLMTVDGGQPRQSLYDRSTWGMGSYLSGSMLLKNYPASPGLGKGLKVVVVPEGTAMWENNSVPAYTATFKLED